MNFKVGRDRPDQSGEPQILHDHGVDASRCQQPHLPLELGHLAGKDQRVERHIAANAAPVQESHDLGQIGAIEVMSANAGVVTLKTEVNGIGAVFHGGRQALSITGRRQ